MTTTTPRICPVCEACCGLDVEVNEGRVMTIRGRATDFFSSGYLCPKGVALKDLHDDPDRLRTPLIKRNGQLIEATWDEAFAEIERRLVPIREQHGPHAIAMASGNPSSHKLGLRLYYPRLAKAVGTHNIFSASTLDQIPKQLACAQMFGSWMSVAVPDIERCDHLVVLGANPMASNGSLWTVPDFRGKAKAMRARGGKLVVIDPRRTETSAVADEHHFIRPGSDVYLLLGMVHTLFDEGLVRLGRLAPLINGVEAVQEAVKDYPAERVAARCGMTAETVRELARGLARAPHGALYGRLGTCTQSFGTLASWLVDVVNILCGHLDEPGGVMFPKAPAFAANTQGKPGVGKGLATGRHRSRVSGAPEVMGELPMGCLAEEIETPGDGQVRALITSASNPVLSAPNGQRLSAALSKLEFILSFDIYLNETTRHADVILPALSQLEESHYDVTFAQFSYRNQARFSHAVMPAPAGHVPEWQAMLKVAAMLQGRGAEADPLAFDDEQLKADVQKQYGERAPAVLAALAGQQGPERKLDLALRSGPYGDDFGNRPDGLTLAHLKAAPDGIDLGPLAPRLPELLRTPSGRIELAPELLLADLPRARAELDAPVPEMVIIGRREVRSNNSWMHNLPLLAKGPFRCTARVHPADAQRLGLTEGGLARIEGHRGQSISAQVEVSDEVMPGVVSLPHGWGHDAPGARMAVAAERPGVNLNAVLDENLRDPLSGNAVLSGVAVRVSAVVP